MTLPEQSDCPRCGVPGPAHASVEACADALIAYYAQDPGTAEAMDAALRRYGLPPRGSRK